MNIYVKDLLKIMDCKLLVGDKNTILDNFSIDTRKINKGDIFIGLKGESFDGSSLYKDAIEKGAKGVIINNTIDIDKKYLIDLNNVFIVTVSDTLKCIQELAKYKRSLYDIPVVGITGSVGKTSTKDIIASVLSKKYKVLKTEGNYNNHIGVPLTVLKLEDHTALVIEMGMNNLGEISNLSKIARPTISVITNVGTAHIGNLGSRENILKAKLEILDGMTDKILVINNDNDLLHKYASNNKDIKFITYGAYEESDYKAFNIKSDKNSSKYNINISNNTYEIDVLVPGSHFVLNSLCALAVGTYFDIDINDIKDGIKNFELTKRRMEIDVYNDVTIINDCYNANLDSMSSAINYLNTLEDRKIAVLGSMLELGDYSKEIHEKIGSLLLNSNIDIIILVGSEMLHAYNLLKDANRPNIYYFDKNIDAINLLKSLIKKKDNILIKASSTMKFIDIFNSIKEYLN